MRVRGRRSGRRGTRSGDGGETRPGEREKGRGTGAALPSSHTRSRSSDDRPRLLAPTLPPSAAVRPLPPTSLSLMPLARERGRSLSPDRRHRRRRRRHALPSPFGAIPSAHLHPPFYSPPCLPPPATCAHFRTGSSVSLSLSLLRPFAGVYSSFFPPSPRSRDVRSRALVPTLESRVAVLI